MITDRNKFNFVTICIGLSFLLTTTASVASAQATNNAQQETNQQQEKQTQHQPSIGAISLTNNKDVSANAILNEPTNGVVHAFSPRLDYSNEWRPVGRGDPLKNDPTFDYSPPTLEHVRYWAETTKESGSKDESGSGKPDTNSVNFAHPNKKDILLLGMPNEHLHSAGHGSHTPQAPHQHSHVGPHGSVHQQPYHQPHPGAMKNAKGETPLLQPKFTSVRRSYYGQQLPTRLMPPPMQSLNSPPINTFNVPMKPSQVHTEYRHSMSAMPSHSSTMVPASTTTMSHMKTQHYPSMSTVSSQPWMYSSPPTMQHQQHQHHHYGMSGGHGISMPTSSQSSRMSLPHAYDSHPQDSHHYFSYTRPSSNSMSTYSAQESYSPNSIRHSSNSIKQTGTGRKPWLHELLQKEVVKTTAKPSYSTTSNKLAHEATKPIYERMPSTNSISGGFTPFTPVTFVTAPPTVATTSTTTTTTTRMPQPSPTMPHVFYPTMSTTFPPPTTSTKSQVIYTTPTTTTTPRTTTSTTSSRLLIPTTSNLAYRPTVAPMQMTTDSLFSHYKQPESPFRGPMYLIIEGHSKVKKYGKNGINLNLPKIVPVIPKREPVIRVAEPGEEKRGTPETFQVEHLHVKTSTTTTTARPSMSSTTKPVITTTIKSITSAFTAKLTGANNATKTTLTPLLTSTTTTARSAATTSAPKATTTISTSTEPKPIATGIAKTPTPTPKSVLNEPLLKLEQPNDPPTGMQGLLSLLDSSLSGFFDEQPLKVNEMPTTANSILNQTNQSTTASTVLLAVKSPLHTAASSQSAVVPVAPDARLGSNADRIVATDTDHFGSAEFSFTTDMAPREVRQVYDYDQLPEARLKDFVIERFDREGDEGASAFYEDEFEEYGDDDGVEDGAGSQQPIKRIDRFDDGEEGEFVGDYEDVELGLGDIVPHANSASMAQMQTKTA